MDPEEVPILGGEIQPEIEISIVSQNKFFLPIPPQQSSCTSLCPFTEQEHCNLESEQRSNSSRKLLALIILYIIVMIIEVIGGIRANSLSIITDAGHLLTDVAGFSISLFTLWASNWGPTSSQSFGYSRLEILGAFFSTMLIWAISVYLIYEAVDRILHKKEMVNGILMFWISVVGFAVNLTMVVMLGHDNGHTHTPGHDHNHFHTDDPNDKAASKMLNINIQGAYVHVMVDMIQSLGVMIAGAIVWARPEWLVADLICTLIFSVLALSTTLPMLRNVYEILMQRTPREIDIVRLEDEIKCIEGVLDIHDLHVWSLTVGKVVLSCHVVADPSVSSRELICKMKDFCEREYRILHVTVQVE